MTQALPHVNLYTRLKVSSRGVGVFAIRDIPAGMPLFEGEIGTIVRVPRAIVEQITDAQLRDMYFDFCPTIDDAFIAPADFNQLTMSWYMNHSANPNVRTNEDIRFSTIGPIAVGEELTINYAAFSDHAVDAVTAWNTAQS